jgi:hypothetical protein
MAAKDDTSKDQATRNQNTQDVPAETSLAQGIEAERARLLQVSSMLHCLYEVLLYADGDDSVIYADAAHLAVILIDESVEPLDSVRIGPMIEAIKQNSRGWDRNYQLAQEKLGSSFDDEVGEPRVIYALTLPCPSRPMSRREGRSARRACSTRIGRFCILISSWRHRANLRVGSCAS